MSLLSPVTKEPESQSVKDDPRKPAVGLEWANNSGAFNSIEVKVDPTLWL